MIRTAKGLSDPPPRQWYGNLNSRRKSHSLSDVPQPAFDGGLEIVSLPIFPLPSVVFFPHTLLPLHIFEPRYRKMVEDSLRGERQIGMVLMREDAELGTEAWHPVGGLGRITEVSRLEDGKFDILLTGMSSFRILEIVRERPYRLARVQLLEERLPAARSLESLSQQLIEGFRSFVERLPKAFDPDILEDFDFPTLVNSICATIPIDERSKQLLLEINDLDQRARETLRILERLSGQQRLISRFEHLRPDEPSFN